MSTQKKLVSFLTAALLCAMLVVAGQVAGLARAAETPAAGYHVGTSVDLSDDDQIYTDATYTAKGVYSTDGNYRRVDGADPVVYQAVFAEDAKSAWIGLSIVGHVTNAKLEVTSDVTDASSWQTKLVSEGSAASNSLPQDPDCILIQAGGGNEHHCYIDVTDLLVAGQASPVYLRLSKAFVEAGNETALFELKFFEGNVIDQPSALIGAYDLFKDGALNEDNWFAHGNSLFGGMAVGVAGNGVFIENRSYGLWTVNVPAAANDFLFQFSYLNPNTGAWEITAFANGKQVYRAAVDQTDGNVSLTEALADCFGEDFRLTVMVRDVQKDGNGPFPKYLQFNYSQPAKTDENLMPAPDAGTAVVTKGEAGKFDVVAAVNGLGQDLENPLISGNDHVAAYKAGTNGAGMPFFDGNTFANNNYFRRYAIFKLPYGKNAGGYVKLNVSGTYLLKVCADESKALEKRVVRAGGDTVYDEYDAYETVGSLLNRVEGQDLYLDVTPYLQAEGGTLYLMVTDPTVMDGNGPLLQNEMTLFTYALDTTEFRASYAGETVWLDGPQDAESVEISMTSLAAGESVSVVKIGDTQLKRGDWSFASGKVRIEASAFAAVGAGTHTVTLVSGANKARVATVAVVAALDEVTAVAVKTQPAKTSFEAGADLDFAGGVLEVTYASGAKASVNMDAEGVGFSARKAQETAGSQSVTVTYGGKSAALTVTVTAKTETPDGETDKGGCGSALFGGSIAGALVLALAAGALLLRKKKEQK